MKIEKITLRHVRVPLVEPFRISNGSVSEKDGIIVSVFADGVTGHGEASPMSGSFYSGETPESTWTSLREELIPRILAGRPESIGDVNAILGDGNPFARAGIETAFWDLQAHKDGVPLYAALGGTRRPVESGLAVGIYPSISELLRAVEKYLVEGYRRLKIKVEPGWDTQPLTEVRKRFGDIPLMVDANCAYTRGHIDHLKSLDEFGLIMIEQPLPRNDLEGHALLQAQIRTPLCLDEGAEDLNAVRKAIALGSCRIINIKIQRLGGLTNAIAVHDLCAEAGVPVWAGTMPELGIGCAQAIHLATLGNFRYPTDVESSLRWFVDDIIDPMIRVTDGMIRIPEGAGSAYRLDPGKIRKFMVREESFAASQTSGSTVH